MVSEAVLGSFGNDDDDDDNDDDEDRTVCEAELAVVVDGDVPVEEVSAGTGVELGGGTFPLIVAEHPLP